MRRSLAAAAAITCVAAGIVAFAGTGRFSSTRPPAALSNDTVGHAAPPKPALYCEFYNLMHSATVVSFYFTVDMTERAAPGVRELFVVEPDGTKTDFADHDETSPPRWAYQPAEEAPTITSPDAATKIVLYGFKPTQGGTFWFEAGLRSNDYRNLEGKCRQANFEHEATAKGPKI